MPYDVIIDRLPIFALFDLKGRREDLAKWAPSLPDFPGKPNTMTRTEKTALFFIGPDRWLLRAEIELEDALVRALRPSEAPADISIVTVSDTMTFFRITGPDAGAVVSIGCPLDTHPDTFGPDAVTYSEFFGLRSLILRCDGGFDCAVEQSFGDMVADHLTRAIA